MRDDLFVTVFDQVFTDTCRYADVVLPATTFLEQHELHRGYGAMAVQRIRPAAAPRGEARPNEVVFADLAARLGFTGPDFDTRPEALAKRFVAASQALPAGRRRAARAGERSSLPDFGGEAEPDPVRDRLSADPGRQGRSAPREVAQGGPSRVCVRRDPTTPRVPARADLTRDAQDDQLGPRRDRHTIPSRATSRPTTPATRDHGWRDGRGPKRGRTRSARGRASTTRSAPESA